MTKLRVSTLKGKQSMWRAGYQFTPNPIEIEVEDDRKVEMIKNEARLIVEVVEEKKAKKKVRKPRKRRKRTKKNKK